MLCVHRSRRRRNWNLPFIVRIGHFVSFRVTHVQCSLLFQTTSSFHKHFTTKKDFHKARSRVNSRIRLDFHKLSTFISMVMSCLTELVNKSDIKMPKDRQFDKKIIQIDNMNWPLLKFTVLWLLEQKRIDCKLN